MEKKPEWLKVSYNKEAVEEVTGLMAKLKLNTVCKEANCPNLGECYKKRTATFMILGSICTRHCRFCNVSSGVVETVDPKEPQHLAEAVKELDLKHVVITSVTRDDLEDGGAKHFADTINAVRVLNPGVSIEVLIPDLQGVEEHLDIVIAANPDVINHNVETVREFYPEVRPEADYDRSIAVLEYVKRKAPHIKTKTGIMVGLGETDEQVFKVMDDSLNVGCDIFTIGQYLQPSPKHIAVKAYVTPEKFAEYKKIGEAKGFHYIASSPLVRSSYRAEEALEGGKS
ncbi:lipoyl synthase [Acetobacterium sp.]|jgi:lipoic acid synthetase|uniref:lipoyl synthase n=1 Tax=Acetobacterium sp. TaxID=1872094 RepID=UPI000CBC6AEC|nr:lipoyl synthase [Acetobacterium sp.]MDO9491597.1 lipoyl synthase [Acetobacterium sp.]PKM70924.1 MAG: lipoyl synthase [Firmicutes bacterium HGW-Firmicutes-17]